MENNKAKQKPTPIVIKNPKWVFWVLLLGAIGCLITFFVFLFLHSKDAITNETFYIGYIFLGIAVACALGVYGCIYEKLTFENGVYCYYRPFGKNRSATVDEIYCVKLLTVEWTARGGVTHSEKRVIFENSKKEVLIKILDDGTISDNKAFLRSLRSNGISVKRVLERE